MTALNREILNRLFRQCAINLLRGAIFDQAPPPLAADLDFAKVEGMMLGLAIGDALGNTSELEGDTRYRPRSEHVEAYEGPIWRFVQRRQR